VIAPPSQPEPYGGLSQNSYLFLILTTFRWLDNVEYCFLTFLFSECASVAPELIPTNNGWEYYPLLYHQRERCLFSLSCPHSDKGVGNPISLFQEVLFLTQHRNTTGYLENSYKNVLH